jgi:hypothetical protein
VPDQLHSCLTSMRAGSFLKERILLHAITDQPPQVVRDPRTVMQVNQPSTTAGQIKKVLCRQVFGEVMGNPPRCADALLNIDMPVLLARGCD